MESREAQFFAQQYEKKQPEQMKKKVYKTASITLIIIIVITAVFTPVEVHAAPKKAKTTYSVNVSNINADTVIKKGTNLKVKYTATKTKLGKVSKVKVKFKSSNKKVATISRKGVIKAKKNGTTYITVYCKNKPKKFKRVKIRVGVPVSSIKIAGYQRLKVGRSTTLKATINRDASNKKIQWASDNNAVAAVNSAGKITAKKAGVANISAIAADGSGVKDSIKVYVHKFLPSDAKWIAHRGLHTTAVENTADAFIAAGKTGGFWGCECDIWETKSEAPKMPDFPELPYENTDNDEDLEIPDVGALVDSVKNMPDYKVGDFSAEIIEMRADVVDAWDNYLSTIEGLGEEGVKAVHEAMVDEDTGDDYLQKLYDIYKYVKQYESIDIVINHDSTFARTMNLKESVRDMTATQIRSKVPKACFLEEYLKICKRYNMVPVVEFKDGQMSREAIYKIICMLSAKELLQEAHLISFYESKLLIAKEMAAIKQGGLKPNIFLLVGGTWNKALDRATELGFTGISVARDLITKDLFEKAASKGLAVAAWTYQDTAYDDLNLYEHLLKGPHKIKFATMDYEVFK